jgi:hypothetical protein
VQSVSLRIDAGGTEAVPVPATTANVIVSFTTETALVELDVIVISVPLGYTSLASTVSISCSSGDSEACPLPATAQSTSTSDFTSISITVGSAGAPPGLYIVTFPAQLGPPAAAALPPAIASNSVTVSTPKDLPGFGLLPAVGGRVVKVQFSVASFASDISPSAGRPVSISFTTQTPINPSQKITVSFPNGYFALPEDGVPYTLTCYSCSALGMVVANATVQGSVLSLFAGRVFPAGDFMLTIGPDPEMQPVKSLGTSSLVCNPAVSLSVSTDTDLPGFSNLVATGGQVSQVKFSLSNTSAYSKGQAATFSFQISTHLSAKSFVTISWPENLLMGNVLALKSSSNDTTSVSMFGPFVSVQNAMSVALQVTAPHVSPGFYSVTFTGVTVGPPRPASSNGISISTSSDVAGFGSHPAIGGAVVSTAVAVLPDDQVFGPNRKIVVSFSTSTSLVCGDTITVTFPRDFVSNSMPSRVIGLPVTFGRIVAASMSPRKIVLTATGSIAAGSQAVTFCGVALPPLPKYPFSSSHYGCGVQVWTNRDYTVVFGSIQFTPKFYVSPNLKVAFGLVTGVSMVIPWANRRAGSTGQSVTFAFKTASPLPLGGLDVLGYRGNYIAVRFPSNFFVKNVAGGCGNFSAISVQGLPSDYQFTDFFYSDELSMFIEPIECTNRVSEAYNCNMFLISSPTNASLPSASYTLTVNGLTFGGATSGEDGDAALSGRRSGISIQTPLDFTNVSVSSGPLSGYKVTEFKLPSCRVTGTCQSVVVSFMSNAGPISSMRPLNISFYPVSPVSGSSSFMLQGVLVAASVANNALILRPVFGTFTPSSDVQNSITITGLTLVATGVIPQTIYASMSSTSNMNPSTTSYSAPVATTSAGLAITTSLVVDAPFVSQITSATVSFTTVYPIHVNDFIYIYFPTNFFAAPATNCSSGPMPLPTASSAPAFCSVYQSCVPTFRSYNIAAVPSDATTSFYRFQVLSTALPPGPNTISISGLLMGNSTRASSNSFYVLTTKDACSGGTIQTGAILPMSQPAAVASSEQASATSPAAITGAVLGAVAGKLEPLHVAFLSKSSYCLHITSLTHHSAVAVVALVVFYRKRSVSPFSFARF